MNHEQVKRNKAIFDITREILDTWHKIIAEAALDDQEEKDRLINQFNPMVIDLAWPKRSELYWQ